MKAHRFLHIFAYALLISCSFKTYTQPLFYRASSYNHEPRLQRNMLTTWNSSLSIGSTSKSQNAESKSAELLNIFGLHNMHQVGKGVPIPKDQSISDVHNVVLQNLWRAPGNGNFGKLLYKGKFNFFGLETHLAQNFCSGFFLDVTIPFYKLEVKNIVYEDQSPTSGMPDINDVRWKQFLGQFNTILKKYSLSAENWSKTSVGDITICGGWTNNSEDVEALDFFDTTIKAGISIPSGKKKDEDKVFSIAHGYDGHVGVPISFDMAMGMYEWFTLGTHVGAIFFFDKTKNMRMQTASGQNGFIKLAKGKAKRDMGHLWDIGTYVKFDHIVHSFSLLVGYSYANKDNDDLTPEDTTIFPLSFSNADAMLKGWKMHTIHISAEYDFANENKKWNPRIALFYNHPVSGKRIFETNTYGGEAGLHIVWDF